MVLTPIPGPILIHLNPRFWRASKETEKTTLFFIVSSAAGRRSRRHGAYESAWRRPFEYCGVIVVLVVLLSAEQG